MKTYYITVIVGSVLIIIAWIALIVMLFCGLKWIGSVSIDLFLPPGEINTTSCFEKILCGFLTVSVIIIVLRIFFFLFDKISNIYDLLIKIILEIIYGNKNN